MGLFHRKKNNDRSASVLSEGEIQQKLYGEFKIDSSRAAGAGDRDQGHELFTTFGKTVDTARPSFERSNRTEEIANKTHPDFPQASQFPGASLKPALSKPVEEKSFVAGGLSAEDPYQKYNDLHQSFEKREGLLARIVRKAGSWLQNFPGLNQLFTRQVLYWTSGVLAVFFLFWGVNALNVGRERAMKTKYHTSQTDTRTDLPVAAHGKALTSPSQITKQPSEEPSAAAVKPVSTPAGIQSATGTSSVSTKRFVIQVVTYPTQEYAERIVIALKQAGFSAYVKENTRPTGTTFYMVLIGSFGTVAEAQQQLSKFRSSEISRPFSDAFVKTSY